MLKLFSAVTRLRGGIIFRGACRFNQSCAWRQIRQVFGEICVIWDHSKNLPIGIIDQADRRTQTISQYFIWDSDGFFFFFFLHWWGETCLYLWWESALLFSLITISEHEKGKACFITVPMKYRWCWELPRSCLCSTGPTLTLITLLDMCFSLLGGRWVILWRCFFTWIIKKNKKQHQQQPKQTWF